MSIKKRVIAGFLITVALVVISIVYAFLYILSVENTVRSMSDCNEKRNIMVQAQNRWNEVISEIDNTLLTRQSVGVDQRLGILTDSFIKEIELLEKYLSKDNLITEGEISGFGAKLTLIVDKISQDVILGKWSRTQYTRHNELASLQRRFEEKMDFLQMEIQKDVLESQEKSRKVMEAMRFFWIFAAAGIIVVSVLTNLSASKNIVLPISKLVDASKAIESGNLSFRVNMSRGDEFDILANSFNSMTSRLQLLIRTLEEEIDEKMKMAEALRISEKSYRDIFENAIDGIFQSTIDGRFIDANPSLISILGYESKEDLLRNCTDITKQLYVSPDERDKYVSDILQQGKIAHREVQLFRKDAQKIWVSLSTRLVLDEAGKPAYLEGFVSDITERKKLVEQLHQSQKMEAIGRLAGGIAHDFNNILTIIIGYCDLLGRSDISQEEKIAVEQMLEAGQRGKRLTGHLLAFSRKQVIKPKIFNPNVLIKKEYDMFTRLLGEDIKTELVLDANIGKIKFDETQFEQVILNIVVNARDAMPNGGRLIIETMNVESNDDERNDKFLGHPGKYIAISFSDEGVGMDDYVKNHLFEPFFTTKDKDKGTGLGLSTVYGIIKQNSGYIYVNSEEGKGSTFTVYIPRVDEETQEEKDSFVEEPVHNKQVSVLLVEDDPGVRKITKEMLLSLGYKVLTADNGQDAIDIFSRKYEEIDVLMTDVIMPVMGGKELADDLTKRKQTLKVVYFSGYTENAIIMEKISERKFKFLQKPFSTKELNEALKE
ncbi:response regulator [candidate division WOR-3 bacterium]|nr:response regulator [candidate division WOR-3 bacterium]